VFHARRDFDVEYRTEYRGGVANVVERAVEPNRPTEVTVLRAAESSKPPGRCAEQSVEHANNEIGKFLQKKS